MANNSRPVPDPPTKVLNVSLPEAIYWQIRRCASESQMSVKAFMAVFCRTAKPIVANPELYGLSADSAETFPAESHP
jgi:hypothetical protein